jgi:hypothetical protein
VHLLRVFLDVFGSTVYNTINIIGEAIPVRLFLGGFDVTPTYKDVYNRFSVSYILNLVLVDEDDRRYFKQREIYLWRKPEKLKKALGESDGILHHQLDKKEKKETENAK